MASTTSAGTPLRARRPLAFIGGAHGTGKTTLCTLLAERVGAKSVAVGELIRQERAGPSLDQRTQVHSVEDNQKSARRAVGRLAQSGAPVIVDGHFTLRTLQGRIEPVALDVFREVSPASVVLVEASPAVIRDRLAQRDGAGPAPRRRETLLQIVTEHRLRARRTRRPQHGSIPANRRAQ